MQNMGTGKIRELDILFKNHNIRDTSKNIKITHGGQMSGTHAKID
jgi:hypothetical protein